MNEAGTKTAVPVSRSAVKKKIVVVPNGRCNAGGMGLSLAGHG
jgi:enoyl-CoA hydratase/carnithine racemase